MSTKDIILNIAVNMGRLSRFAIEKDTKRIDTFIMDTDNYLEILNETPLNKEISETLDLFKTNYNRLKNSSSKPNEAWAEDALTWANILTHRAKLA